MSHDEAVRVAKIYQAEGTRPPKKRTQKSNKHVIHTEAPREPEAKRAKPAYHEEQPKSVETDEDKSQVIPIGIMPEHYPEVEFSIFQQENIKLHIGRRIHFGWTSLIRMTNIHYKAGYLVVDCLDEDTVTWLTETVTESQEALGMKLRTVRGEEIPQEMVISAVLPESADMDVNTILKTIQASNKVDTSSWDVIKCEISDSDIILQATISPVEQMKILGLNNKLHFMFGQVEVSGLGKNLVTTEAKVDMEEGEIVEIQEAARREEWSYIVRNRIRLIVLYYPWKMDKWNQVTMPKQVPIVWFKLFSQ